MLNICPWGYTPHRMICATCKYVARCKAGQPYQEPVVLNGLFGVWRAGASLVVGDADGHVIPLETHKLDCLIQVLQAAQQELA